MEPSTELVFCGSHRPIPLGWVAEDAWIQSNRGKDSRVQDAYPIRQIITKQTIGRDGWFSEIPRRIVVDRRRI